MIVDESAHLKKRDKSVAVGRQYAGVIGKVDNGQVGVYASMVNDNRADFDNVIREFDKICADSLMYSSRVKSRAFCGSTERPRP